MRLILGLLALAQLRLARLDYARGDMLMDDAEAALTRARERIALGHRLADRAGQPLARLLARR
ncbi:hypothetical protein MKK75_31420 [Methylobacterium sp. J-030]|uniref:hypothetical protein n=1 Tax=Methylobacterium sp. J-030 TaxID=2836627 RepID=UPI001FBA6AB5|nr:hypothetical protein [Methylobacterium sp. J-030]MCJ2073244.1 hypothetical protein [Methylobacterium sp. J-030]